MTVLDRSSKRSGVAAADRLLRFDRVAITSVFGDPFNPRTWSGAPYNTAMALRRRGVCVRGIDSGGGRGEKIIQAARHAIMGYGVPRTGEALLRGRLARRQAAQRIAKLTAEEAIRHVLHMGTLDLPALDLDRGVKHYLYCDHTWALSLRHRPEGNARACEHFESLEREALAGLEHVFTFGDFVRDNLIEHYRVEPGRVTAVGSGMGDIHPYLGEKNYARGRLLFVAKHLFGPKGGELLLDAFRIVLSERPETTLTVIGDERCRHMVPQDDPAITFHGFLPREELQHQYREATLLTQPMLNDPWGQVYLEALASRTPVVGLARNGLPEIVENGRHGFLAEEADPRMLARVILDALADPGRLKRMGESGQRHVLRAYSWDRVGDRIAFVGAGARDARASDPFDRHGLLPVAGASTAAPQSTKEMDHVR